MTLSDKMWYTEMPKGRMIFVEDVKQFIKELKDLMQWEMSYEDLIKDIDKLAGEKLIA